MNVLQAILVGVLVYLVAGWLAASVSAWDARRTRIGSARARARVRHLNGSGIA